MAGTLEREEQLFDAAMEINSPAERASFLDRECAGDAGLRARLEKLLAAHERAEQFFIQCRPALTTTKPVIEAEEYERTVILDFWFWIRKEG